MAAIAAAIAAAVDDESSVTKQGSTASMGSRPSMRRPSLPTEEHPVGKTLSRDVLRRRKSELKNVMPKENEGPSDEDLKNIAGLWDKKESIARLAEQFGIKADLIRDHLPANGDAFAKALYEGLYTADKTEEAKADLRDRLYKDILTTRRQLKATTTRKMSGPSEEDLEAMAKLWEQKESIVSLATKLDLKTDYINQTPPISGDDFARAVFQGLYTADKEEEAKSVLRDRLRQQLITHKGQLKRVETRRSKGPSAEDLTLMAQIFDEKEANFAELAKFFPVSQELLEEHCPATGEDFAKNLYNGQYTSEKTEMAKFQLRAELRQSLLRRRGHLSKGTTNEFAGPSKADIEALARIYDEKDSLEAIATRFGLRLELLKEQLPEDGEDFAMAVFEGLYTADATEAAKFQLRENLGKEIIKEKTQLKHVTPQESQGPSEMELQMAAQIYYKFDGNLTELAKIMKAETSRMYFCPPTDGKDFAMKLFQGLYTLDPIAEVMFKLRASLAQDVKQKGEEIKRRGSADLEEAEKPELERLWYEADGDMKKIARVLGCDANNLQIRIAEHPPKDGMDFAERVLLGAYLPVAYPDARTLLRERLVQELDVTTKTRRPRALSQVLPEDVERFAKFYSAMDGKLQEISKRAGIPYDVMKKNPPADAEDFASKLLDGYYTVDMCAASRENLRQNMRAHLMCAPFRLKKTGISTTRRLSDTSAQDVVAFGRFFEKHSGDLEQIAAAAGLDLETLRSRTPTDSTDFAIKLLQGYYTTDMNAEAKQDLRVCMRKELRSRLDTLTHTETKKWKGEVPEADTKHLAQLFQDYGGDLEKLASEFDLSLDKLNSSKPADGTEFARKVLLGHYEL